MTRDEIDFDHSPGKLSHLETGQICQGSYGKGLCQCRPLAMPRRPYSRALHEALMEGKIKEPEDYPYVSGPE
jgi:hypothetical protein